ncbi:MAG: hypothetical protein Kow0089_21530 [Desulfobulbaceae bacterium]
MCGYVHVGEEPPEECPVCGADRSKFEELLEPAPVEEKQEATAPEEPSGPGPLVGLMLRNHLHPIAVHTPNGIVPAAAIFLLLAVVFGSASLEKAAFFNMVVVLLAMPAVLFTGIVEWRYHYGGAVTPLFLTKIVCGSVVLVLAAVLAGWRIMDPGVAATDSPAKWIFLLLHLGALGAVGIAGNLGGKLVFGRRKR